MARYCLWSSAWVCRTRVFAAAMSQPVEMLGIGMPDCQTDPCELELDSDLRLYFICIECDALNLMKIASKSVH